MKLFGILAILLLASGQASAASGGGCAACTLLVSLVEQIAIDTSVPVKSAIKTICGDLSPKVKFIADICAGALEVFAPQIEKDFQAGQSPDYTCHKTLPNMCKDFPTCQLYTKWPPAQAADRPAGSSAKGAAMILGALASIMNTDLKLDVSTQPQEKVKHLPIFDNDGDRFSTWPTLRGSHWRGKDCDDAHGQIYPGRATDVVGPKKDHNCNGIFGTDGQGNSYESRFCAGTGQRGVVVLGDSAAAHFHIPPEWLTAKGMDNTTYSNLLPVAEDEADYPACSGWTGWMNLSSCPYTPIKAMDSIYLRIRDRNRCNHRDFQNIGVNGGSTGNMAPPNGIIMSLKSRNGTDQPALVFYALIGNDVCNHHADFDHMTTPQEFETNVLSALDYLDANLAPNSYVVFISLADGRVLYETMSQLQHPVGTTYATLYDYLNCLDTSPCWGWMNGNATVRDLTTQRAQELSGVYSKIISERNYKNFKMHYVYADIRAEIEKWVAQGGKASDLIEPTDGFHPSQTANLLTAATIWDILSTDFPEALGPINPNNDAIGRMFGDQGGY